MGKKKILKGDQYFTTGYVDYVPGSSTLKKLLIELMKKLRR